MSDVTSGTATAAASVSKLRTPAPPAGLSPPGSPPPGACPGLPALSQPPDEKYYLSWRELCYWLLYNYLSRQTGKVFNLQLKSALVALIGNVD